MIDRPLSLSGSTGDPGRFHWSRFVIVPASWFLDRCGRHNACDDLDAWAASKGLWHR